MKKILAVLFVATLLLSGCSGSKKTTTVCKADLDGIGDTMTLEAEGDRVTNFVEDVEINFEAIGITTEEDKEFLVELLEPEYLGYDAYDGVTVTTETTETAWIVHLNFDLNKVDYDTLVELGFADPSDDKVNFISLDVSKESFEDQGYNCTTK